MIHTHQLRVTLSLHAELIPDGHQLADPAYFPKLDNIGGLACDKGRLALFYVPTPGLMAWFAERLAADRAEMDGVRSYKISESDKADIRRMLAAFEELKMQFPVGAVAEPPAGDDSGILDAGDFEKVMRFVDGKYCAKTLIDGKALVARPGRAWEHGATLIAWRGRG